MVQWLPPPANPQPPGHRRKLRGPTDGDYWRAEYGGSGVRACDSLCAFARVFEGRPLYFLVSTCAFGLCVGKGEVKGRRCGGAW